MTSVSIGPFSLEPPLQSVSGVKPDRRKNRFCGELDMEHDRVAEVLRCAMPWFYRFDEREVTISRRRENLNVVGYIPDDVSLGIFP